APRSWPRCMLVGVGTPKNSLDEGDRLADAAWTLIWRGRRAPDLLHLTGLLTAASDQAGFRTDQATRSQCSRGDARADVATFRASTCGFRSCRYVRYCRDMSLIHATGWARAPTSCQQFRDQTRTDACTKQTDPLRFQRDA